MNNYCTECGTKLQNDTFYCPKCGLSIEGKRRKPINIKLNKFNLLIPLLLSLLMVIIHNLDIAWYLKNIISLFALLIIGTLFLMNFNKENIKNKNYYFLLIPYVLILLSSVALDSDISNKILNVLVLALLFQMIFIGLLNKKYKLSFENLSLVFDIFPKRLFSNLSLVSDAFGKQDRKKIGLIIKGSVIGLCFGLVILVLLVFADDYFDAFVSKIFSFLDFGNIILFILYFICFFSISVNVLNAPNLEMKERKYCKTDAIVFNVILTIINFIFVLFTLSEVSKLTGNFLGLPNEYTYAAYAREGFFELLVVTIINYALILFIIYKTKLLTEKNNTLKILTTLLIIFSVVLIFNSYYRMYLYISVFGFTVLRLQVLLFLLIELIIFGILLKKIFKGLKFHDAWFYLIIVLCFYIINIYTCNSAFIDILNKFISK